MMKNDELNQPDPFRYLTIKEQRKQFRPNGIEETIIDFNLKFVKKQLTKLDGEGIRKAIQFLDECKMEIDDRIAEFQLVHSELTTNPSRTVRDE